MTAAPLSVCLISQEFPPETNWGGVGVQFDLLARGLAARGHGVTVISRATLGAPAFDRRASGVTVWRVGTPITRKRLVGRTMDRILHARDVAAKVAELERMRPFDVFESAVASLDAERLAADPRFSPRIVICCHGTNAMGQAVGGVLGPLHALDWKWSAARETVSLHRVPAVTVSSRFTLETVMRQGVDPSKIDLIPLGVDTARFTPPTAGHARRPLVVGFAGRLEDVKGIDFVWRVLDALGLESDIKFRLKGNIHPATRADVEAQLQRHAAIAAHEPAASHDEMPAFFQSIDVLLLPSRIENFGLTYAEAMASGALVFAGRGGAGAEMVQDGVTGFLVDPAGPAEPVAARLRQLAHDRHAFDAIRVRARQYVIDTISVDRFIDAKVAQYRRVGRAA